MYIYIPDQYSFSPRYIAFKSGVTSKNLIGKSDDDAVNNLVDCNNDGCV